MQAVSVCFAIDHVDGDHTIDQPAQLRLLARLPAAVLGRAAARLHGAAPAHAGDRRALLHARTRTTTRCWSTPTSGKAGGDGEPVDVPAHRRAAQLHAGRLRQRHLPRELADDRLLRGPDHRRARGRRRAPPAAAAGAVLRRCSTGCRPRRRAPTAAPGFPGLRLRGDVTGTDDGLAQAPYIRESRRIRAGTRSSSRTCRSRCAATRARCATATASASACTASTCTPRPAATTTSTSPSCPFEIPLGALLPAAGDEPAAGRQEHRHHPHHQRLLPAAPGRVERRRGRRRARRVLPRPRRPRRTRCRPTTPSSPTSRPSSTRDGVETALARRHAATDHRRPARHTMTGDRLMNRSDSSPRSHALAA